MSVKKRAENKTIQRDEKYTLRSIQRTGELWQPGASHTERPRCEAWWGWRTLGELRGQGSGSFLKNKLFPETSLLEVTYVCSLVTLIAIQETSSQPSQTHRPLGNWRGAIRCGWETRSQGSKSPCGGHLCRKVTAREQKYMKYHGINKDSWPRLARKQIAALEQQAWHKAHSLGTNTSQLQVSLFLRQESEMRRAQGRIHLRGPWQSRAHWRALLKMLWDRQILAVPSRPSEPAQARVCRLPFSQTTPTCFSLWSLLSFNELILFSRWIVILSPAGCDYWIKVWCSQGGRRLAAGPAPHLSPPLSIFKGVKIMGRIVGNCEMAWGVINLPDELRHLVRGQRANLSSCFET